MLVGIFDGVTTINSVKTLLFSLVTMSELRCDVIVDDISSIDIETTTKELYLDDSPEEFVLRGMNEEGYFGILCQFLADILAF